MGAFDDHTTGVEITVYYNTTLAKASATGPPTWAEIKTAFPNANLIEHVDTVPDLGITPNNIEATHYGEKAAHKKAGIPTPDDFALVIDIVETNAVHAALAQLDTGAKLYICILKSDTGKPSDASKATAYIIGGTIAKPGQSFPKDEFSKMTINLSPDGAYWRVNHG